MNLQQFINSSLSIDLAAAIGRSLPVPLGIRLADFVAEKIANRRDSNIVRAVRANQWVVSGGRLSQQELDKAAHVTFQQSARAIFNLYHYLQDQEAVRQLIVLDRAAEQLIKRPEFDQRGLLIAGLHISGFDLALQGLCQQGLNAMVLTLPDPQGSQRKEYERRRKLGINLVPTSVTTLRQALKYLQQGGVVLTGIDRPIPEPAIYPRFFGQPAALPTHYVFLALKARIPIIVMATFAHPDGKYHIRTSDPIEMDLFSDQAQAIQHNAEKVLSVAEAFIQQAPQQWTVSLPVWPGLMDKIPQ